MWLLEERISIRDAEIFAVGKIAESPRFSGEEDSSLQTAFPFYILAEGRDIIDGKMIGVLMECSGAERRQNDNLLIPYAHKGKSSDNLLDRSLDRALMCSGGVSESSRICLQSLKSRLWVAIEGCLWRLSQKDDKDKCRFIYTTKPDTMC